MKLVVILLSVLIAFSLLGCGGQLKIDLSPGFLFSRPVHTVKILNGTLYSLRINLNPPIMIQSGGQDSVHYLKKYENRKVALSVSAIVVTEKGERKIVGTASKEMRISSFKRSSVNTESLWHITRLKPMR